MQSNTPSESDVLCRVGSAGLSLGVLTVLIAVSTGLVLWWEIPIPAWALWPASIASVILVPYVLIDWYHGFFSLCEQHRRQRRTPPR